MFHFFLDLIFPRVCGFCDAICKEFICDTCIEKIKKYTFSKKKMYVSKSFTYHYYLFSYQDIIRQKLIQYKFHEKSYLANTFWKLLVNDKKICRFLGNYDIIIPVPMYHMKRWKRGYNQAQLITKKIANSVQGLAYQKDVLVKVKNICSQSTLSKVMREQNVIDVFTIKESEKIVGKRVILFDDVYTTGSTVEACTKELIKAGAKEISVLTIAKD